MTEAEIRTALKKRLAASPQGAGAAFIVEMFVDGFSRRADLVMANGKLAAFEIKSDRDSLSRLDGQLQTYLRFFEQVTVVCAERHLPGVLATAPGEVGVLKVAQDGSIRSVRSAVTVRGHGTEQWASFLPVDELKHLLRIQGQRVSGSRDVLVSRLQAIDVACVREFVLSYLKRRDERIAALTVNRSTARQRSAVDASARLESLRAFLAMPLTSMTATPRLVHSSKSSSPSPSISIFGADDKSI